MAQHNALLQCRLTRLIGSRHGSDCLSSSEAGNVILNAKVTHLQEAYQETEVVREKGNNDLRFQKLILAKLPKLVVETYRKAELMGLWTQTEALL
eukprot:1866527-Heterocapsa_arctica.AAC.1